MTEIRQIKRRINDSYRKNKDDIRAILLGIYPKFVYRGTEKVHTGEIPVFVFHAVQPRPFERQLRYLAENNYNTLNSDEIYNIIIGKKKGKENSVVLTFDDGHGSLWSTAYPLLKKYDLNAISFIIPFTIKEKSECYPNLDDVWDGKATLAEIEMRESKEPFCTWNEIIQMHKSGIIDFQSHTSYHNSTFVADKLIDFINPAFQASLLQSTLNPVIRKDGKDIFFGKVEYGQPIFQWAPAMSGKRRYFEDENLSLECINFVKQNGYVSFFTHVGWRKKLKKYMSNYATKHVLSDRIETIDEKYSEIRRDLLQSKIIIEEKLNKRVKHLCYPWYEGSSLAVKASMDVGYLSNHWGILGNEAINRIGDPYHITRINDDYIFTLPGKGRISLYKLVINKLIRVMNSRNAV